MQITLTFLCLALIGLAAAPAGAQEGSDGAPRVALETSKGRIVIELDPANAPKSTENFLAYVRDGFYDGTIFHRVIPGFMNQGGGFEPGLKKKDTRGPIQNEADNGLKNDKYTVAMARTNDPHSATAQFFINTADNAFLNHTAKNPQGWGYTVFGRVVEGQDVVDAIAGVPTGRSGMMADVPQEDVVIQKAEVIGIGGGDDSEAESAE